MLLSDAALSAHEWYFRTISTIRGNLRQIKLLVFLMGRGERVIVKCWVFFFSYFFFLSCLFKLKLPQLSFIKETTLRSDLFQNQSLHPQMLLITC